MKDVLGMFRKTLETEGDVLHTPGTCTIDRAMELVASAYQLGYQKSDLQRLREEYIGLAMQGLLSQGIDTPNSIARYSISYADAIIEKLKKEQHE